MKLLIRRDGTTEEETKPRLWRRMRLRRSDGSIYLDRWGIGTDRLGRIYVHRMQAPDPGIDLHDHPWTFVSIVLKGGYTEQRALCREAPMFAAMAEKWDTRGRGVEEHRGPFSIRMLRLDECHTITGLDAPSTWTLCIGGPRRRRWGFYLSSGYLDERTYDETVRADRRDLWNEAT